MKRRYLTNLYTKRVEKIREMIPNASIGVDVIVGFPDESEQDFNDTYNYINSLDVSYLHVFSYSARPNTPADAMVHKISPNEIDRRSKMLQILSDKKQRFFYEQHLGSIYDALWEGKNSKNLMFGFTENYIKVETDYNSQLINSINKVGLKKISQLGNVLVDFE